jgi:hypothetical protein
LASPLNRQAANLNNKANSTNDKNSFFFIFLFSLSLKR